MTVCVECGCSTAATVEHRVVGGVSTQDSIRLARCGRCGRVCDKYEERDAVLVVLDAVLLRRPALRHLLCNTPAPEPSACPPRSTVLAVLTPLFWLAGLRADLATALAFAVGAVLPCLVLWAALGDKGLLGKTVVVALNVAFPAACLCLVWGPQPSHILHTFAALLYLAVLCNAYAILGKERRSNNQQQQPEHKEGEGEAAGKRGGSE